MARLSLIGVLCACLYIQPALILGETGASQMEEQPAPQRNPEATVRSLSAHASEWREPSAYSETRYVLAINQWLASLEPEQKEAARKILAEAHPDLAALRKAIREKKTELAELRFDQTTRPDTLPRLGLELAGLRQALSSKLRQTSELLQHETGLKMELPGGDGFWLVPPRTSEPHV